MALLDNRVVKKMMHCFYSINSKNNGKIRVGRMKHPWKINSKLSQERSHTGGPMLLSQEHLRRHSRQAYTGLCSANYRAMILSAMA